MLARVLLVYFAVSYVNGSGAVPDSEKSASEKETARFRAGKRNLASLLGQKFGDRKPWEGRQEQYGGSDPNRFLTQADFFTKIRKTWENSYVSSPEDAFGKPLCGTLNATAETTYYGKWHANDRHFWWEPHQCRLRRLSVQEARQCLNGRHVFMGGDSLTRYQYLSLVSFLSQGEYMAPWAHGPKRSLAVEREWDGWEDFFKAGSDQLASEAKNATAHEECDCTHGPSGGYEDVPSHEIREFTLRDFTTLDGKQSNNLIRVSNRLVYHKPSHVQLGIETLLYALKELPQLNSMPDVVILNMGIWVRDWTANGNEYQKRFETVMQHGEYFRRGLVLEDNALIGALQTPLITVALTFKYTEPKPRLLWKSTTSTVKDKVDEEAWNAVNEGSLKALEVTPGWQLYDVRALSRQALEQHLNLYSFDAVHFAPQMYQEFNDFLLNILCSPDLEFQTDNLPATS